MNIVELAIGAYGRNDFNKEKRERERSAANFIKVTGTEDLDPHFGEMIPQSRARSGRTSSIRELFPRIVLGNTITP